MKCPICSGKTGCIATIEATVMGVHSQRRRRKCLKCGRRFSTFEVIYDRGKAWDGLRKLQLERLDETT